MDPRLRTFLVGFAACLLAAWIGIELAQEQRFTATLAAGLCVWGILSWTGGPLAEAWLLGFLFFGYVVGNRGFAQVTPIGTLPLFLSELGLGFLVVVGAMRGALERRLPWQGDGLNRLLLGWFALGMARITWDVRAWGFLALRDFALVYYVLYFFTAQAIVRHAPSRRLLRRVLLLTFAVLPLTGLLALVTGEFFLNNLLVNGVPLIFYKGDLLATFLYTGFIVLLPVGAFTWKSDGWRFGAAIVSLLLGLAVLSRASMVGLLAGIAWLAWAGFWRPVRVLCAVAALGLVAVTVHSLLQKKDFTQTNAYAIYEAVTSIADFSGTRDYRSEASDKGDNNRFRLVWWRNVADETLRTAPVFGLGFGADLARGFLAEYYPTAEADFSARSPHNVFMTTLGRMGLAGAAVLLLVYLTQAANSARVARALRRDPRDPWPMTLQAACWVIMVSACFGVVFEGPMGAIPFWTLLALAHHHAGMVARGESDDPALASAETSAEIGSGADPQSPSAPVAAAPFSP